VAALNRSDVALLIRFEMAALSAWPPWIGVAARSGMTALILRRRSG